MGYGVGLGPLLIIIILLQKSYAFSMKIYVVENEWKWLNKTTLIDNWDIVQSTFNYICFFFVKVSFTLLLVLISNYD
jgi:hypothetical protein